MKSKFASAILLATLVAAISSTPVYSQSGIILTADQTTLTQGQCTTLHYSIPGGWSLVNIFGFVLLNSGFGTTAPIQDSQQVCPTTTTTYTISGNYPDGVKQASITITVLAQPTLPPSTPIPSSSCSNNDYDYSRSTLYLQTPRMNGADVVYLQNRLLDLGYQLPNYGADGWFGEETDVAVREFQSRNALVVDGIVGPITWACINNPNAVRGDSYSPPPLPTATSMPPTWTPIPPTWTSIPPTWTSVPPTIVVDQPLANDGWDPGSDLGSSPFTVEAASPAQDYFEEGQCTWFVAGKRADILQWLGSQPWNAYLWTERARENGAKVGVYVGSSPEVGDIAVWQAGCHGTSPIPPSGACTDVNPDPNVDDYQGCGHVAYVTWSSDDKKTFKVEEANWNRLNPDILVDSSCMSFIHLPVAPTQSPSHVPATPSPNIFQQIWDWIKSLFGF